MVDVIDLLKMRVFHQRNRIKARHLLAHHLEGWVQRTKCLHICAWTDLFVLGQDFETVMVTDRHDRFLEFASAARSRCTLLGFNRVFVAHIARETIFGRDDVRRDTLGHEIGFHCQIWIGRNRSAI